MKNTTELKIENNAAWYKTWFDSVFYHQLYSNRSEKEAIDFIDALMNELNPPAKSTMLDLGCGAGRHAKRLAAKGFDVMGLDLAPSSIRSAKKYEKANLHFAKHDMRDPFGDNSFDYVFNFFTSFGYFKSDKENNNVISNISRALKPGGSLILDYLNVAWCEDRVVVEEAKEIDGIIYRISRWADERFFYKKIAIEDMPPGQSEFIEQVAKFDLDDFDGMFKQNGLKLDKVFGDYRLSKYDAVTSPRMILVANKRAVQS
ncbi:MAG TPA: class I SAM-dependent methyltransferase [Chitinophagaceae bacterium]|nr:class I SAM-dependent methyltransferase [Chitinophagaceae bacterium]